MTKQEEDKIFQEGYAKGRLRCLQQHYRDELENMRKGLLKEIEEKLPKEKHVKTPNYRWVVAERDGYNQVLKKVKEILEKMK